MIYSVNYPIIYELPTPVVGRLYEYRINYGTTEDLFVGRVIGNGGGTQIDISRILQKFTDVCYYDKIYSLQDVMYFNTLNDEHNNSYFSVIVIDMNTGVRTPFDVMYNYNTDYINQYPYTLLLNDPITNKVDRRQRINLSSFGLADQSYLINGVEQGTGTVEINSFGNINLNIDSLNVVNGDTITLKAGYLSYDYKVVEGCSDYVIHYVNKLGGLDSLICEGKSIINRQAQYTDVLLNTINIYHSRQIRNDFDNTRLQAYITKSYQLNTPILTLEESKKMDNLIFSPKVWIEDLNTKTITACLVRDTQITGKWKRDGIIQYQINLEESQLEYRRG